MTIMTTTSATQSHILLPDFLPGGIGEGADGGIGPGTGAGSGGIGPGTGAGSGGIGAFGMGVGGVCVGGCGLV